MAERRVWLAQCLCPGRHAVLAATCEAETLEEAQHGALEPLKSTIVGLLAAKTLNPWCALCHAPATDWFFETGRTRFASMAEAEPVLQQLQAEQVIANALFGDIPRND